ncbi:DUF3566 domain-containing protein [Streptomyces sp. NPDC005921]
MEERGTTTGVRDRSAAETAAGGGGRPRRVERVMSAINREPLTAPHRTRNDVVLALGVAVLAVAITPLMGGGEGIRPGHLGWMLLLAGHLPLVWRRRRPVVALLGVVACMAPYYAFDYNPALPVPAIVLALYTVAATGAVRRTLLTGAGQRTAPRTRKARLRVAKADPWSVMKVSFLLSIALGICSIVASAVLWMVLDAMGVFSTVGGTISEATGSNESNGFDLQSFLSLPHVLTFTAIIAVIDVVLATALATLGAFIYNLSAGFVGGIELTLAEDE